jgi:hypothetical protein
MIDRCADLAQVPSAIEAVTVVNRSQYLKVFYQGRSPSSVTLNFLDNGRRQQVNFL